MIKVNGREIQTDAEGYLASIEDWNEEVAVFLSAQDEFTLSEKHWQVINWVREFYEECGTAPSMPVIARTIGSDLGEEFADSQLLSQLFPAGPSRQAARYAGMPKPIS